MTGAGLITAKTNGRLRVAAGLAAIAACATAMSAQADVEQRTAGASDAVGDSTAAAFDITSASTTYSDSGRWTVTLALSQPLPASGSAPTAAATIVDGAPVDGRCPTQTTKFAGLSGVLRTSDTYVFFSPPADVFGSQQGDRELASDGRTITFAAQDPRLREFAAPCVSVQLESGARVIDALETPLVVPVAENAPTTLPADADVPVAEAPVAVEPPLAPTTETTPPAAETPADEPATGQTPEDEPATVQVPEDEPDTGQTLEDEPAPGQTPPDEPPVSNTPEPAPSDTPGPVVASPAETPEPVAASSADTSDPAGPSQPARDEPTGPAASTTDQPVPTRPGAATTDVSSGAARSAALGVPPSRLAALSASQVPVAFRFSPVVLPRRATAMTQGVDIAPRCSVVCSATVRVTLSASTARRLRVSSSMATVRRRGLKSGDAVRVRFPASLQRALAAQHGARVLVSVAATDSSTRSVKDLSYVPVR